MNKFIITESEKNRIIDLYQSYNEYINEGEVSIKQALSKGGIFFLKKQEYIFLIPKNYTGKKVHVLFAGSHSFQDGEPKIENMKNYIPVMKPYAKNVIIVITHHNKKLSDVEEYVKDKLDAEVQSIAGFSAGGVEAWRHAEDSDLTLVGLIDPSTTSTKLKMGPNTYMVAQPSNWGGYPGVDRIREILKWYCSHKNDSEYEGKVFCPTGINHWGFLKYFYDKYSDKI